MHEASWYFNIGPIWFDGTLVTMTLLTCVIIFVLVYSFSRNLKLKPTGKQNALEYVVDFVRGIASSQLPKGEVTTYHFFGFVLFLYILVSNEIGLLTKVVTTGEVSVWKSPTADPIFTLSLSFMVIVLSHFFGVQKLGAKGYFVNTYLKPVSIILPIKILEEFTNVISLGLRLYGNIFAGEILLGLIASMVSGLGWLTLPVAIPLEMVWIGFSLFIGGIQAYVFVTLTMVFLSHKIEAEH